jgi:hypothetical protein
MGSEFIPTTTFQLTWRGICTRIPVFHIETKIKKPLVKGAFSSWIAVPTRQCCL